jgi:hypothetical protein
MSVKDATKKFPEEAGISRYGQPEEIAELLGSMVSQAAKRMTGTSVRMDGGEIKVFRRRRIVGAKVKDERTFRHSGLSTIWKLGVRKRSAH